VDGADRLVLLRHRRAARGHDGVAAGLALGAPTRLFIGLLGAAYIHLAWVGLASGSLWYGFAIAVVWMIAVMRFG
jgi:predicted small integral membrane protein